MTYESPEIIDYFRLTLYKLDIEDTQPDYMKSINICRYDGCDEILPVRDIDFCSDSCEERYTAERWDDDWYSYEDDDEEETEDPDMDNLIDG